MSAIMESSQSAKKLVRRAQRGERDAFEELVEHYRPRLQAAVRRRIGSFLSRKIEVEDVLQETFLKAFQSLRTFENRGDDAFYVWLKGISENLLLYWARQHQRRDQMQLDRDLEGSDTSPSRSLRREERFERLQAALSDLSSAHREVILLARVKGLTLREIATQLGKTPEAVKSLLWRALEKLRAAFGETESLRLPDRRLESRDRDGERE